MALLKKMSATQYCLATWPSRHMKDALGDIHSGFTLVRVTGAAGLNPLAVSVSLRCILLTRNAGCQIDYKTKLP